MTKRRLQTRGPPQKPNTNPSNKIHQSYFVFLEYLFICIRKFLQTETKRNTKEIKKRIIFENAMNAEIISERYKHSKHNANPSLEAQKHKKTRNELKLKTAKLGIDATKPLSKRKEGFEIAKIPKFSNIFLKDYLKWLGTGK